MISCRTLFTKSVSSDEVGKIFGFVSILSVIAPQVSSVVNRKLYNATVDYFPQVTNILMQMFLMLRIYVFPQAFLMVAGAVYAVTFLCNLFLWTRRHGMQGHPDPTETDDDTQEPGPDILRRKSADIEI